MKRISVINVFIAVAFLLCDPLLNCFWEFANTHSLGAEMVLGMLSPILFVFFVLCALCSVLICFIKCFCTKEIKQLIPILFLVAGIVVYALICNSDSFWIKIIDYYITV